MKKILVLALSFFFMIILNSAKADIIADKIYVTSIEDINVEALKTNQQIHLYAIQDHKLGDESFIEEKSELTLKIKEKIEEKRGKRNEYLKIELISYTIPSENEKIVPCKENVYSGTLKNSKPKDLKEISKKAGVTVVGKVLKIPVFSQAIAASKGLIKPNENQSRLKSAGTNLYKSTPLTYFEKGNSLTISENTVLVVKLREKED